MRFMPTLLAAVLLSGPANADEAAEKQAVLVVANQHMVLNFLSALYYCQNGRWPQNVGVLRAFREEGKVTLPVEPDWVMLQSEHFTFDVTDRVIVRSTNAVVPNAHVVTSTNTPPVCREGGMEIKANIHIGQ